MSDYKITYDTDRPSHRWGLSRNGEIVGWFSCLESLGKVCPEFVVMVYKQIIEIPISKESPLLGIKLSQRHEDRLDRMVEMIRRA